MVWNFILWSVLNSPVLVGVLLTIVFSLRNLCFQYQVALKCLFFYLLKKKKVSGIHILLIFNPLTQNHI